MTLSEMFRWLVLFTALSLPAGNHSPVAPHQGPHQNDVIQDPDLGSSH